MITFYFNSNLPEYYTGDLCEVFDNLMLKFILLLNDKKLHINRYIATNNQPTTILIIGKTLKTQIYKYKIAERLQKRINIKSIVKNYIHFLQDIQ